MVNEVSEAIHVSIFRVEQKEIFCYFLMYKQRKRSLCFTLIYSYEGWNFNSDNYLFTTDTK